MVLGIAKWYLSCLGCKDASVAGQIGLLCRVRVLARLTASDRLALKRSDTRFPR